MQTMQGMTLANKVAYLRRCAKYDRILRKMRLKYFNYEDAGLLEKAERIQNKIKKIQLMRNNTYQQQRTPSKRA